MLNFLLEVILRGINAPAFINQRLIKAGALILIVGITSVTAMSIYVDSTSDSYRLAKKFIQTSSLVKRRIGEGGYVGSFPAFISRNDSVYYFTKAGGLKGDLYIMCAMYLDHSKKWQLAYITEQKGQFEKLKRLK